MSAPELLSVLHELRALLARADNDYSWSSWQDAGEALADVDALIARVAAGMIPRKDILLLFAPTGAAQEVSLSSGWGQRFVALAASAEALVTKAGHS